VRLEPLRLRFWPWFCLRDVGGGGGGVFFGRDASGCGTEGNVSGLSFAMVCVGASGAACASGGGGSGLLGSGLFKSLLGDRGVDGRKIPCRGLFTGGVRTPGGCCQPAGIDSLKSANDTVWGPFGPRAFPCRCFGGGGGPSGSGLDVVGPIKETCSLSSSSSSSEIDCWSKDVLGDSGCNSCAGSNRDCRDTEDVSVLLSCGCWGCVCCVTGGDGLALPVMRRFLNISTFILGGPPAGLSFPRSSVAARCTPSCASLVANVLANGL